MAYLLLLRESPPPAVTSRLDNDGGGAAEALYPSIIAISGAAVASLRGAPMDPVGIVTASFGVASWRVDEGIDGLLLRADSAVYVAKQAGRDRVEAERLRA